MCLPITVTVDPPIIDQKFFHCSAPLGLNTPVATVTICVTVKKIVMGDIQGHLDSMVSVALELELDPWARAPRLLFVPRSASFLWTFTSNLSSISPVCTTQYIGIPVVLEKVCGEDHVCISDLNVSLSFLRLVYNYIPLLLWTPLRDQNLNMNI
ncbi:Integrin alpha-X [Labeo rohita]|uniref:Integrin alpha-X n=1 Tax=Labeo rohita TaxID=84645 RepID=A0ABQ8MMX8_LABRO|nr:Integrin alpha-X [Labeo rohita]